MPILKDAMLNQGTLAQLEKRVKAWALRNQEESGCIVVRGTASPNDAVCDTVLASGALGFTRIPSLSLKVGGGVGFEETRTPCTSPHPQTTHEVSRNPNPHPNPNPTLTLP